jgi:rare lipoprotein A
VTPRTTDPEPAAVASPVETTLPTENVADHAIPASAPVTVPPTTTTTTTEPPVAVAAQAPAAEAGGTGQVTYYDHPAGTCASPWLPFGTEVEITNPANGESVSCVVNDREADTARSIDLATSTFALIAPLSQGVIDARLTW